MKKLFTVLFTLMLTIFAFQPYAQTYVSDDFIYGAGSITTANPLWKTISGTLNQLSVTVGGLTYTGYKGALSGTGNNKISLVAGNTEDVNIFNDLNGDGIVNASDAITSGSFYYSFLVNVSATTGLTVNTGAGDYFAAIAPSLGNTNYAGRLFMRQGSTGGYQLGLKFNTNASNLTTWLTGVGNNMALGTTYLLVLRYTFNNVSTFDDVMDMWVNPALTSTIPTPLLTLTNTGTTVDLSGVGSFVLRQGTNTPSVDVDGLLAGGSWNDVPLPVTLSSLSASLIGNQSQVNWQTFSEINFDYFGVEKSLNAQDFVEIGKVNSNKAANGSSYQFADVNKTLSNQFYRLKMVDNDGTFKYSSVVAVNGKASSQLEIYPNPATNTIILSHPTALAGASLKIVGIDGKILSTNTVSTGATQTSINVSKLMKGNYMVSFINNGVYSTTQLVRQ